MRDVANGFLPVIFLRIHHFSTTAWIAGVAASRIPALEDFPTDMTLTCPTTVQTFNSLYLVPFFLKYPESLPSSISSLETPDRVKHSVLDSSLAPLTQINSSEVESMDCGVKQKRSQHLQLLRQAKGS